MSESSSRRKRVRHFHEPGDLHELTFSCYRRTPLLTNDQWRHYLPESIDAAMDSQGFRLVAFVYMPDHVHLIVLPLQNKPRLDRLLAAIKRPCSVKVKQDLVRRRNSLIEKLTVRERPGRTVFRFWQEGPGYDRNLQTIRSVQAVIDYVHLNPMRRGLCQQASAWRWSSAGFYETDGRHEDRRLPRIDGLPPEFFDGDTPVSAGR